MKVLFITDTKDTKSGWGRYAANLKDALEVQGHEVKIIAGSNPRWFFRNPFFLLFLLPDLLRIRRMLKHFQPDILHVIAEPYALLLLFLPRVRTAITVHGTYAYLPAVGPPLLYGVYRNLYTRVLARAHAVIAVSNYTKEYLLDSARKDGVTLPPGRVHTVSNGIQISDYSFTPVTKKTSPRVILTVGAVKSRKGILETIRALGVYQKKYGGNFVYRIVGADMPAPGYKKMLEREIRTQNLSGKVFFLGKVSEEALQEEYKKADLFLMLARVKDRAHFEGFGLVYLEANAHGLPVIASNEGGSAEAVENGKSGFVVDPDNPDQVAERIHDALDGDMLKREDARAWALAHDMHISAKAILEIYSR